MEGDDGWRRTPRARVQNTLGSAASLAHRMLGLNEADAVRDTWLLLSRSAAGEQSARDVRPVLESLARSRRKTPSHAP